MYRSIKHLSDIESSDVYWLSEFEDYYYVKLISQESDSCMWKIDKKTGNAYYMETLDYVCQPVINDKTLRDLARRIISPGQKGDLHGLLSIEQPVTTK